MASTSVAVCIATGCTKDWYEHLGRPPTPFWWIFPLDDRSNLSDNEIMKAKQFLKKLEAAGVNVIPGKGKGGHYRLERNDMRSVLSVHGAKDLGPEYMKVVCKQLGLDPKDVY